MSSDDDPDFTEEWDGQNDSEHDSDVEICMEDDVDAPDGVDSDYDVDTERDGDDEEEDDQEADDEQQEDEDEEEDKNEDEGEDQDEDEGKEPRTIGQGEMVNTLAEDVDSMVDDKPLVPPEQGQEMCEHTPQPEPQAPVPWPKTTEPRPWPQTPETHPLSGLDYLGLVTLQKPPPAVWTLRETEAAINSWDVAMDQQLLGESAGGDTLPDIPHHDVSLIDASLPVACQDGSVGEEWNSSCVAEEAMVVAFG